jgi:hypothetical protein
VPYNPDAYLSLLSEEAGIFYAYGAPADYVRDAFGVEIFRDSKHEGSVLLRESTFLRNAKFLAVDAKTSQVLAFAGIGSTLELSASPDSRRDAVDLIQRTISTERRPIQLRRGTHVVETEEQRLAKQSAKPVDCRLCQDTKEMVVSHNLRLYRVPCPDCNSAKDQPWRAFPDAFRDASQR